MRFSAVRFATFLNCSVAVYLLGAASGAHGIEATLAGWGEIKLGITPDEVRAIPGMTWTPLMTAKSYDGQPQRFMMSHSIGTVEGFDFDRVIVQFDAQLRLTGIRATYLDTSPGDAGQCEQKFQKVLKGHEAKYGEFAPVKDTVEDEYKITSIHDVPGAMSKYEYAIPNFDKLKGTTSAGLLIYNQLTARAYREFGGRIRIDMTASMPDVRKTDRRCDVRVTVLK